MINLMRYRDKILPQNQNRKTIILLNNNLPFKTQIINPFNLNKEKMNKLKP